MSGFASANPWLVLMRNGERSKSSSSEDDSGPLAVTSDTDSEPDEAEEAGSAGPNQEPKKTTASTNRDHSSDGQPKETTNTGTGGDQDHRSEADKQQRLYERVAELSGQALTSDSNSQGIFCDRPQKARETSAGGQTASGERPAQDQQPAAIPVCGVANVTHLEPFPDRSSLWVLTSTTGGQVREVARAAERVWAN